MLLRCVYKKRKVIAILGVQVLNSEAMSVKNMNYKAIQSLQRRKLHQRAKGNSQNIIGDLIVLL